MFLCFFVTANSILPKEYICKKIVYEQRKNTSFFFVILQSVPADEEGGWRGDIKPFFITTKILSENVLYGFLIYLDLTTLN